MELSASALVSEMKKRANRPAFLSQEEDVVVGHVEHSSIEVRVSFWEEKKSDRHAVNDGNAVGREIGSLFSGIETDKDVCEGHTSIFGEYFHLSNP